MANPATLRARAANGYGGVIPTGRLDDLVRAAIGPDPAAQAWTRYLAMLGSDTADEGERRLYPFVGARLGGAQDGIAGIPDEALHPIRRERRRALLRMALLQQAAARIARDFAAHGIATVMLKGLALQVGILGDAVPRASSDVDLFIPLASAEKAVALAWQLGWQGKSTYLRSCDPEVIVNHFSRFTFLTPGGLEIDIHWIHRDPMEFDPRYGVAFFEGSRVIHHAGHEWRVPSDASLLFETIEHGLRWNGVSPVRWLVDAAAIISPLPGSPPRKPPFDWPNLVELAERAKMTYAFAMGLEILSRYSPAVPEEVISTLRDRPVSWLEQRHTFTLLSGPRPPFTRVPQSVTHYLLRGPGRLWYRIVTYPNYCRRRVLHCQTWRDLAARALDRLTGREARA